MTDRILDRLSSCASGCKRETSLLKAAVIDRLYRTNVFAILPMAEHVADVLTGPRVDSRALAEKLALGLKESGRSEREYLSFASRLVRFYIDSDRVPIL